MSADPENERFQEMITELFEVLKTLETEVIAYRTAQNSLTISVYDNGFAADVFQRALESARRAPHIRKALDRVDAELAQFRGLSNVPIGPKIEMLLAFLQAFRSGDSRFFPSDLS